jgi:hypothetical protein
MMFADGVLLVGVLGLPVAAAGWGIPALSTLAVPTIAMLIPRALGLKPALEAAFGLALLVASWSIILDLYASWTNWDLAVHAALNGLVAAVGVSLLTRLRLLPSDDDVGHPRLSVALVTTMFGVFCGVLWEFFEWAANEFFEQTLFVSYSDTLADIAVGGVASAVAGCALAFGGRSNLASASAYNERSTHESSSRTM